ncbi:GNAT family N-acetyltransferase [Aliiroseovarius sp. N1Y82]|nr:GNAT family N-acetyltransferase [Aliiroseovarius subalbicans]
MIHPHHGNLVKGEDPDAAYLWRLLVSADVQRRGVGRFAISECIAQAREWGLPRLASSVVDAKNSNMGFYERVGFHQTGIMIGAERQILMDV